MIKFNVDIRFGFTMTVISDLTLQFLKSGVFLTFLSCFVLSLVFPLVYPHIAPLFFFFFFLFMLYHT